jgi:hypothetical protein
VATSTPRLRQHDDRGSAAELFGTERVVCRGWQEEHGSRARDHATGRCRRQERSRHDVAEEVDTRAISSWLRCHRHDHAQDDAHAVAGGDWNDRLDVEQRGSRFTIAKAEVPIGLQRKTIRLDTGFCVCLASSSTSCANDIDGNIRNEMPSKARNTVTRTPHRMP